MTEPLTEKLLSCYKAKGLSSLLVCFAFIFCRVMAFIRYIGVDFTFGLLDCVRYNEDFVISRYVILRFCSIHFTVTVTLAGLKNISFVIRRTSLFRGSLNRGLNRREIFLADLSHWCELSFRILMMSHENQQFSF